MIRRTLERRYMNLYRQHRRQRLSAQEFIDACGQLQYERKGIRYGLSHQGVWLKWTGGQWQFHDYLVGWNRQKLNILAGYSKRHLARKALVFLLLLVLMIVWFRPNFIRDTQNAVRDTVAYLSRYQSPAMEKALFAGVTVKAPKGALTEEQTLSGQTVALDVAYRQMLDSDAPAIPLYAFEFNGGLEPGMQFKKAVTLSIDLTATGIDPVLHDQLRLLRREADGSVEQLDAVVKDGILTAETKSNSLFVLVGGSLAYLIFNHYMLQEQYGENYSGYRTFILPGEKYGVYKIHCNADFMGDMTPAYQQLIDGQNRIKEKYGLVWSHEIGGYTTPDIAQDPAKVNQKTLYEFQDLLTKIAADPEYKALADKLSWEAMPRAVQEVGRAVVAVHDYLFDVRKLKPLSGTIHVILLDAWPHSPAAEAMEEKKSLLNPTIQINPSSVKSILANGADASMVRDELKVTLAHEMFHAVQHLYYDKNTIYQDLRFSEATAVLLEGEAAQYFKDKKVITSYNPTFGDMKWLTYAWTERFADTTDEQNQGYAFAKVLAFQRDSLSGLPFGNERNQYLERLLNARASYSLLGSKLSGADASTASIYSTLAPKDQELMYRFMHGTEGTVAAKFLLDSAVATDIRLADTTYSFKMNDMPCTVVPYAANVDMAATGASQPGSVLLYHVDFESRKLLDFYSKHILGSERDVGMYKPAEKIGWFEIGTAPGLLPVPVSALKTKQGVTASTVFVTDEEHMSVEADRPDLKLDVVLAVPPVPAKRLRYDEGSMSFIIELEPETGGQSELVKGRCVEIEVPGTSIKPFKLFLKPGVNEGRLHILDLLLNEGDDSQNIIDAAAAKMLETTMTTSMRSSVALMTTASQGMLESSWQRDAMYVGISESYSLQNEKGEVIYPARRLQDKDIPIGVKLSIEADRYLNMRIRAENGAYIYFKSSIEDAFRYVRYTMLPFETGLNLELAEKRLKELDESAKVACTVRSVYGEGVVDNLRDAVRSENSYYKTALALMGPASTPLEMKSPRVEGLPSGLQDGLYQGHYLFTLETNLNQVIREYRDKTRDTRIQEAIDARVEAYIEDNQARHEQMRGEEGQSAVLSDIEIQRAQIRADVLGEDMTFDSEFYMEMQKAIEAFNGMTYSLQIDGSKGVLSVMGASWDCAVAAGGKAGQYKLTVTLQDMRSETFDLIMMPDGRLIIKGEPAILERK